MASLTAAALAACSTGTTASGITPGSGSASPSLTAPPSPAIDQAVLKRCLAGLAVLTKAMGDANGDTFQLDHSTHQRSDFETYVTQIQGLLPAVRAAKESRPFLKAKVAMVQALGLLVQGYQQELAATSQAESDAGQAVVDHGDRIFKVLNQTLPAAGDRCSALASRS